MNPLVITVILGAVALFFAARASASGGGGGQVSDLSDQYGIPSGFDLSVLPPRQQMVDVAAQAFLFHQGPERDAVKYLWGDNPWAPSPAVSTVCTGSYSSVDQTRRCVDTENLVWWYLKAITGRPASQTYSSGLLKQMFSSMGVDLDSMFASANQYFPGIAQQLPTWAATVVPFLTFDRPEVSPVRSRNQFKPGRGVGRVVRLAAADQPCGCSGRCDSCQARH